ncbi:MAG: Phosphatidylinositol 3,5-bisphosphate-binding protein [Chaenotheca gracillima]|nr:MAG: Phosphatidylinositol 3,5-bisphosphate-binding protein [Chaenotheca gracillima]
MGRKRRTAADRANLAREKGYNDDDAFADEAKILKPMTDGSEESYREALEIWAEFSKSREGADPHDMLTAKRFIDFYACGTLGQKDDKPTTHSVDGFWRRFTAAWARKTFDPILFRVKKSVKNVGVPFIHGPLQKKYNLPTEKREKHFLTLPDAVILQEQLWRKDWYKYKHERYRVQMTAANVLFVCTSGRVGEFFESGAYSKSGRGLCYRDMTFTVRRRNGVKEIVVGLFRQHAKGTANKPQYKPKHTLYEKSDLLWCSPVLRILAVALTDDAFKGYSTLEEIFDIEPPEDQNI